MSEIPWPTEQNQPCWLIRSGGDYRWWYLYFRNPKTGGRAVIPVSEMASSEVVGLGPVWQATIVGRLVKVSPSIHAVGDFHSPNPVYFRLDWKWWNTGVTSL